MTGEGSNSSKKTFTKNLAKVLLTTIVVANKAGI